MVTRGIFNTQGDTKGHLYKKLKRCCCIGFKKGVGYEENGSMMAQKRSVNCFDQKSGASDTRQSPLRRCLHILSILLDTLPTS